ncbi:lipoxygenase [Coprinopsis sp. MPI-PUGE-AT-0042]|nr:lipoxygenase [Coprinopsis sp. MPI-PUGE-AT-0042]
MDESVGMPDTSLTGKTVKTKRKIYQWSTKEGYPPHLSVLPIEDKVGDMEIFDKNRWEMVQEDALKMEAPHFFGGLTLGSSRLGDAYTAENIGLRSDWYTDAVFAQQQFTGVNPTGLKQASEYWIKAFIEAASHQKNDDVEELLVNSPSSFYVVDNSDYRRLLGLAPNDLLVSESAPTKNVPAGNPQHGAASVTLFSLSGAGKLHPVAICLDYRGSMSDSVTIFNKRLTPGAQGIDEAADWPWRYAKMCSSMSDWTRHELAVHLSETHLIEEAIIVAAQRNFDDDHIICQILHPHWYKTLSLNLLARQKLVPDFIEKVAPIKLDLVKDFIKKSYTSFDFVGRYAPNDLKNRGFDPFKLGERKFHNYLYARNISKSWDVLRGFVSDVLHGAYPKGDPDVVADKSLASFCAEMRSPQGAQLPSFPVVKTLEELIDMTTMCIHIASNQHNAINYLQQFYLSFVPNRPGSLAAPIPQTLAELKGYTEQHIIASLPMTNADMGEWLLMAQVPYLLSAEVDVENNVMAYANSTKASSNQLIAKAGGKFADKLKGLEAEFNKHNKELDDRKTPYYVLHPAYVAQSVLI